MKIIKERIIVDYGDDDIISIPIYPQYQKVLTTGGFKYQNDPCITCSNNPVNGGSGICHCILGTPSITC